MNRFYKNLSFLFIFLLALALGLCTISFSKTESKQIVKPFVLDKLEEDIWKLRTIHKFCSTRENSIKQILKIMNRYNEDMSQNLKYLIANEIYEMDLKYDIVTDVKLISHRELSTIKGKQPFIINALESGIVA